MGKRRITRALISVYHKEGIELIAKQLTELNIEILSTGGTYDYLKELGIPVISVEEITSYPSILGGRVKTLHPKIFGGILYRRNDEGDALQVKEYEIPEIDLVIVDLYPFEEYVASNFPHQDIIEKIDIGGISLIRAAAKNYKDVVIISTKELYPEVSNILVEQGGITTIQERRRFAGIAFNISSHYDTAIFKYFNRELGLNYFKESITSSIPLRYGENPHQKGDFFGSEEGIPKQIHGKEISYNNLLDIEAAIELISDFEETTVAILKHNNACGCACSNSVTTAWNKALAADPISAFGGIIVTNAPIDGESAAEMDKIFFEVLIAPSFSNDALDILKQKKNRILLICSNDLRTKKKFRSLLGGVLVQDRDSVVESEESLTVVTKKEPTPNEVKDMIFANKIVKHSKSNAIVLVKDSVLIASGVGQTSRVDAVRHAIEKARNFGFPTDGAVMASDAFFPFPDSVELAHKAGISAVIQPGGSLRDSDSIEYCNVADMTMVMTNTRHFKH